MIGRSVRVAVLVGRDESLEGERVIATWASSVSAAVFQVFETRDDDAETRRRLRFRRSGLGHGPHLVLVGLNGGATPALRLALRTKAPLCGGLVVCGRLDWLSSAMMRIDKAAPPKLRYVWQSPDPLVSAGVLSVHLRSYRASGMDAQAILVPDHPGAPQPQTNAAAIRACASYPSELAAVAMAAP